MLHSVMIWVQRVNFLDNECKLWEKRSNILFQEITYKILNTSFQVFDPCFIDCQVQEVFQIDECIQKAQISKHM